MKWISICIDTADRQAFITPALSVTWSHCCDRLYQITTSVSFLHKFVDLTVFIDLDALARPVLTACNGLPFRKRFVR